MEYIELRLGVAKLLNKEAPMKRILRPFEGLDEIEFGTPIGEVKQLIGVEQSTVRNRHLKQEQVNADRISYIFENGILVTIEMKYQDNVYFKDVDIFNTEDLDALLQGYQVDTKRKDMHIKELGLILLNFALTDHSKREVWYYSKQMLPAFDRYLDVV